MSNWYSRFCNAIEEAKDDIHHLRTLANAFYTVGNEKMSMELARVANNIDVEIYHMDQAVSDMILEESREAHEEMITAIPEALKHILEGNG